MKFYCGVSVTPMRKEASDRSEMVSQLLYGEVFSVIEALDGWCYIITDMDNYKGWIDSRISMHLDESQVYTMLVDELFFKLEHKKQSLLLTYGAEIFCGSKTTNSVSGHFDLPSEFIKRKREIISYKKRILEDVERFINVPYLWGGRSPLGIDCSGLIQVIHKVNGIIFPRDSDKQALMGTEIKFNERTSGDLAFFYNSKDQITHVGILTDKDHIIHASGWVRKDMFTNKGIHPQRDENISHKLAFLKRIFIQPESHRME